MVKRKCVGLAGKADYVVFSTDYENYGAIFSCQSILFGHRRSASILSRRKTLDQMYINKVCYIYTIYIYIIYEIRCWIRLLLDHCKLK